MAEPFIGEIRQFAGIFAPQGWSLCNGQLLSISDYDTLFTLIGTTYGGDGQNTFAVPDLQGRVPLHVGSGYELGGKAGSETITLVSGQLPAHPHTAAASSTSGSGPSGNVWGASTDKPYAAAPGNATMNPSSIGSAGGNQPHENRIPFVAITYIIALEGIFPTQG